MDEKQKQQYEEANKVFDRINYRIAVERLVERLNAQMAERAKEVRP